MNEGELWHLVEAKKDDGSPTLFRIRELDPRPELTKIFVVEMPFRSTEMSHLPNAAQYRRLDAFRDQWLGPACGDLNWELVAEKIENGSVFIYLYGASDPNDLVARFSPFDPGLGFYDDDDPAWAEYAFLRELLDQAKLLPPEPAKTTPMPKAKAKQPAPKPAKKPAKAKAKPKPKPKPKPKAKPKAKKKK